MSKGVTKRANILDEESILDVMEHIDKHSREPLRDRLLVLLTCRLGLRAQEAARVCFEDILDARGRLKPVFFVTSRSAKYGKARNLPMHPQVKEALLAYLEQAPKQVKGPLFHNQFNEALTSEAVQKQLSRLYNGVGLHGCSSHSGRRTFGTRCAQNLAKIGGTMIDLAHLMGHSSIATTQIYVDHSPRQAELVMML